MATLGGHWLTLQTLAWTQMLLDFSKNNSLPTALAKTFDGQHPCRWCIQVSHGWHQERQEKERQPGLKAVQKVEFFYEPRPTLLPARNIFSSAAVPFVPQLHLDLFNRPPTPPPRSFYPAA
jgi:hypothetical protein